MKRYTKDTATGNAVHVTDDRIYVARAKYLHIRTAHRDVMIETEEVECKHDGTVIAATHARELKIILPFSDERVSALLSSGNIFTDATCEHYADGAKSLYVDEIVKKTNPTGEELEA